MTRAECLEGARQAVCFDRNASYGEPEDNFSVVAEFWSTYLETKISPEDVANMMILFKVARSATAEKAVPDTWVDICGYAACGAEIENSKEDEK